MNRYNRVTCLLLLSSLLSAAETPTRMRLPWEDLKRFLNLDHENIRMSWDEFRKILSAMPAGRPSRYQIDNGDVVVTRSEFAQLLAQLPERPLPDSAVRVTRAAYVLRVLRDNVRVSAHFTVHQSPSSPNNQPLDLCPISGSLQEVTIDGKPALTRFEGGRLWVTLPKAPLCVIEVKSAQAVPEAARLKRFSFAIRETPITVLEVQIPEPSLDIQASGAPSMVLEQISGATRGTATLSPASSVEISWNPLVPSAKRGAARVYADVDHLVSVEDNAVRLRATVHLQVLQNTISSVVLNIPRGFTVLKVEGQGLREWAEVSGEPTRIRVPFEYAREGMFAFTVEAEQTLSGDKVDIPVSLVSIENTVRQKSTLGVELQGSAEVAAASAENLERVDIQELPAALASQSERPLVYGYRALQVPAAVTLSITRHPDVSLVKSVIDSAEATTHFLHEGKQVTSVVYQVRNSGLQFLTLRLPRGAELWSAFVGEEPVKPTAGPDGTVLIPLLRSQSQGAGLLRFPVEIIFYRATSQLWLFGWTQAELPQTDLLTSRLRWTAITPFGWNFISPTRAFERETVPVRQVLSSPINPSVTVVSESDSENFKQGFIGRVESSEGKGERSNEHNKELSYEMIDAPAPKLLAKSASGYKSPSFIKDLNTGVLPIRVNIPADGRAQKFVRTLPDPAKPLRLPYLYCSGQLSGALKAILCFGMIYVVYRRRRLLGAKFQPLLMRWKGKVSIPHLPALTAVHGIVAAAMFTMAAIPWGAFFVVIGIMAYLTAVGRCLWNLLKGNSHE